MRPRGGGLLSPGNKGGGGGINGVPGGGGGINTPSGGIPMKGLGGKGWPGISAGTGGEAGNPS